MSGADLANLVNEAALHAVRRGVDEVAHGDFETARDRVLMGQRRESMALSDDEKERIAYHEGGHAVLAYVLAQRRPGAQGDDPPDRHGPRRHPAAARWRSATSTAQDYIEDSLVVRMGGRVAEELVYGDLSTGANNDLVGNTELARKMVREWGMSEPHRPDGLGLAGAGVPRRGPHAHPRLLRRHRPGDRRGGRADPARAGGAGPEGPAPAPPAASTPWPAPCSSTRPSTAPRWPGWSTRPPAGASGDPVGCPGSSPTPPPPTARWWRRRRRRRRSPRPARPLNRTVKPPPPPARPAAPPHLAPARPNRPDPGSRRGGGR